MYKVVQIYPSHILPFYLANLRICSLPTSYAPVLVSKVRKNAHTFPPFERCISSLGTKNEARITDDLMFFPKLWVQSGNKNKRYDPKFHTGETQS